MDFNNTQHLLNTIDSLENKVAKLQNQLQECNRNMQKTEVFFENISVGLEVCELNEYFTPIYINNAFTNLTSYTFEDIKKTSGVVMKEDKDRIYSDIHKQLKQKGMYSVEYRIQRKDGSIIWILDQGTIFNCSSSPKVQSIMMNLTHQKEVQHELEISEIRYQVAMQFADVEIFDYDTRTKKLSNRGFQSSIEDMLLLENISQKNTSTIKTLFQDIDSGKPTAKGIIYEKSKDDNERILEIYLTNIFDKKGNSIAAVGVKKDITEKLSLQRERDYGYTLASERELCSEVNITKDIILKYDQIWAESIGLEKPICFSEMVNWIGNNKIHPKHRDSFLKTMTTSYITDSYNSGNRLITFEYMKDTTGLGYQWYEQALNIIQDNFSGDIIIRNYIKDIHKRKERERKATEEKQYYEQMISKSIMVYEVNITQNLTLAGTEGWEKLFDIQNRSYYYTDLLQALYDHALHPNDRDDFDRIFARQNVINSFEGGIKELSCDYRRPDETGDFIWVRCTMHMFEDPVSGDIRGFSYVENINAEKKLQLELIYKSQHDILTSLLNKSTVEEKINQFFATSEAKAAKHAFFIVDLDRFKAINDNFGHVFGDAVISNSAGKLVSLFRSDDIIGRIGGDEFIILMKNIKNEKTAISKAVEICDCLTEIFHQNNLEFKLSASIGIAFYGVHGRNYNTLYHHSDTALYASKQQGRNKYSIYNSSMKIEHSNVNDIDSQEQYNNKLFNDNINEYIFRILYETVDRKRAINSVLEIVGIQYNLNRIYIFEEYFNKKQLINTFEWCDNNVCSQKANLPNILVEDSTSYKMNFNEQGYYVSDTSFDDNLIQNNKTKSFIQFLLGKKDKRLGFIGFECHERSFIMSQDDIKRYKEIANILSAFIIETKEIEKKETCCASLKAVIDSINFYAYVTDPLDYTILFFNQNLKEKIPDLKIGDCCYRFLHHLEKPCNSCHVEMLRSMDIKSSVSNTFVQSFNSLVSMTTSWIEWNGKKACLTYWF